MNQDSWTEIDAQHDWYNLPRSAPPKRSVKERVADFLEVYGDYDEATAREQARRCVECAEPLCVSGCPLGNRIPEWMLLTAEGRFLEAAALSRSTSNMPEICARVCPQERLCEGACVLNGRAEPVAIGAIERFINEYAFAHGAVDPVPAPPNGMRVAVLGSGPGGLSCADELARRGYAVTVYESQPTLGGLLVNGIPAFKLEKSVVARRISLLEKRGVVFKVGVTVGRDISLTGLLLEHDAIFLGFGAQRARPLGIPGADLAGIYDALPFLVQKNTDTPLDMPPIDVRGKRVAVLGGGDTAMDCLRTAIRCGAAEALCIYRRDRANMPGSRKEYDNSIEEGARFSFLTSPVSLLGDAEGRVTTVRCVRMELGAPDSSGRRSPRPVRGSEFDVPVDVVLTAYGFELVPFAPGSDLAMIKRNDRGEIVVDDQQMTSMNGVFAGGDLVRGPSLVVHAVRDARRAALGIHRYLSHRRMFELDADQTDHLSPELTT